MSPNGYSFTPDAQPRRGLWAISISERPRQRYWLHALLLLATFLSTTIVGVGLQQSFDRGRSYDFDFALDLYVRALQHPSLLLEGLPFSLTLITILLAHEFGHYLTARYYEVDASLPYFLPAPTLIGTFGAFIRLRSAIETKRSLFDIGVGGPLAGFAVLIWPLAIGVSLSKVIPGAAIHGDVIFGTPLILRLFEWVQFHGVPLANIYLHPVARAAWVGLLSTALNLLPIGQLDGGHILYSFVGDRTKLLSRVFVVALGILGIFFFRADLRRTGHIILNGWMVWTVALVFLGMRHPSIVDHSPLGRTRNWLGVAALVIFILSFTVAPVSLGS